MASSVLGTYIYQQVDFAQLGGVSGLASPSIFEAADIEQDADATLRFFSPSIPRPMDEGVPPLDNGLAKAIVAGLYVYLVIMLISAGNDFYDICHSLNSLILASHQLFSCPFSPVFYGVSIGFRGSVTETGCLLLVVSFGIFPFYSAAVSIVAWSIIVAAAG